MATDTDSTTLCIEGAFIVANKVTEHSSSGAGDTRAKGMYSRYMLSLLKLRQEGADIDGFVSFEQQ